ncbi:MAG: molybdopterin cofactor-binding domain-containing protein [Candidatus Aminicenantes bacterium RBG_16_66_30]
MKPVKIKPRIKDDEYPVSGPVDRGDSMPLERREFLKLAGGGLVVFFAAGEGLEGQEGGQRGQGYPDDPNAYLKIGTDGRVTGFSGKIEMGQGTLTALQMMLAEELDVPLASVDMIMGDTALCPYDGGTFGSRSIKYFGPALRQAAAEARGILIRLASAKLGAPEDGLATKDGAVYVVKSPSKKVSYAALVGGKTIETRLEKKPPIKPVSAHTVSGKPTLRTDGRAKVTGEAKYAGDIRVPGMLYAAIVRPPAHGAKLQSADTSAAEKVPGVKVVRDGDLIAVLHEKPDVAAAAVALVKSEFDPSPSKLDNSNIFAHLKEVPTRTDIVVESGNLDEGAKLATKLVEKSYFAQYVAHAPSEPHTAVVRIDGNNAEVWASTQSPFRAQQEIARTLGLDVPNVRVRTPFVGCGFGGKNAGSQIIEAARLAKLTGKPVQVAWSRKEEFFYDTFRPAATYDIRAGLDAQNKIVLWDYKNYHAGSRSSQPVYDIPHKRVTGYGGGFGGAEGVHPFGTGAWRGPGSNTNIFATESHIDVMAEAAGVDPLSFRLANLTDARMKRVVQAAAGAFGHTFAKTPSGRGYGVAITDYLGTYLATMAEVAVDRTSGTVRVLRVVCAQDTGEVINPEGSRMQIEGCITMGLGYCLTEEIRFKDGAVLDENYDTYELPRMSWLPKIEVVLVDNPDLAPQGCGEPAITVMGAVVANAINDAVGARLTMLPMSAARIKEALAGK